MAQNLPAPSNVLPISERTDPVIVEHRQYRLLTKLQIAAILQVSVRQVDRLVTEGMPNVLIGKLRRFCAEDVHGWLKRRSRRRA